MLTSNHAGRVAIHDCYVRGISDTAYELDGIADLSMENCVAADDPQIGFYFMNNRTGESEGQKYVLENCVVETKTNQASTGRYNYGGAFRIWALTVPFGDLVMNNCAVKNQLGATIVNGTSSVMPLRMEGYIRSLTVRDFSVRYTSLNATALTRNVCLGSLLTLQGRTAADRTPTELTIDGFHYYVQGTDPTSGTAGLEGPIFHFWKATNNATVDMRNLDIKCDITNAKRPMEVFAVDGGTYGSFNVDGLTMHGAAIGARPGG